MTENELTADRVLGRTVTIPTSDGPKVWEVLRFVMTGEEWKVVCRLVLDRRTETSLPWRALRAGLADGAYTLNP